MTNPHEVPFRLRGLDHVVLRVRDVPLMLAFYQDVLGCSVERVIEDQGLWQLRCGSALIDLVDVSAPLGRLGGAAPGPEGHNVDHLCLSLDTFDAERISAWLQAHDIPVEPPARRYGAGGFGPSLYLQDPEGNRLELKGSGP